MFGLLVSSFLSVATPGDGKKGMYIHGVGSMYDTVEIKLVRKKCMPFWLFCGLNDEVVWLFTAALKKINYYRRRQHLHWTFRQSDAKRKV